MQTSKLETLVIEPKTPAQRTIIWLHGLGADGYDFAGIVPELKLPDELAIRFIFPHAPVQPVTINAGMPMRAWFDVHGLTHDAKQDEAGIKATHQEITALITKERNQGIAADKILLAGFSQGGAIALYTGLTQTERLAGIIALSTFLPTQYFWIDKNITIQRDTPIFMAHGEFDPVVDFNLGKTSKDRLITLDCKVDWHTYPMPHSVCPQEIQDIGTWLRKVLI
ncbi:MAG TPA: alpha/beta hydrolase-fold protein [Gammaproteobacteria bacterium]|nr:alpha/beta hydrolase-fold protein [Gammaproteobacteria bacterium]